MFDSEGANVCTVGADKAVNYWDLRNSQAPVFSLNGKSTFYQNLILKNDFRQILKLTKSKKIN